MKFVEKQIKTYKIKKKRKPISNKVVLFSHTDFTYLHDLIIIRILANILIYNRIQKIVPKLLLNSEINNLSLFILK